MSQGKMLTSRQTEFYDGNIGSNFANRVKVEIMPSSPDMDPRFFRSSETVHGNCSSVASTLKAILCNVIERHYYDKLQRSLNKVLPCRSPAKAKKLCFRLGRALLQLRWRIKVAESGHVKYEDAASISQLCMVMYFHYCALKMRLPSHVTPETLDNVQDYGTVWGESRGYYPRENSIEGWEAWVKQVM